MMHKIKFRKRSKKMWKKLLKTTTKWIRQAFISQIHKCIKLVKIFIRSGVNRYLDFPQHFFFCDNLLLVKVTAFFWKQLIFQQDTGCPRSSETFNGLSHVRKVAMTSISVCNQGNGKLTCNLLHREFHVREVQKIKIRQSKPRCTDSKSTQKQKIESCMLSNQCRKSILIY